VLNLKQLSNLAKLVLLHPTRRDAKMEQEAQKSMYMYIVTCLMKLLGKRLFWWRWSQPFGNILRANE